jgi:hypothetical protein
MTFGKALAYVHFLEQDTLKRVDVRVDPDGLLVDAPGSGKLILRRAGCRSQTNYDRPNPPLSVHLPPRIGTDDAKQLSTLG